MVGAALLKDLLGASNDACLSNSDCESNICVPGDTTTTCANSFTCGCWASGSCCNDAACSGQMTCQWVLVSEASNNSVVVRACNTSGGSTKSGESCTSTTMTNTCSGGICASFPAQNGDLCTQPCCSTSDCMGIGPGWICGPYPQQLNVGEVVLLVCQPTR